MWRIKRRKQSAIMRKKLNDFVLNFRNKYINYKLFGKKGAQICPIWFNSDIQIKNIKKGDIEIQGEWTKSMIIIGAKGSPFVASRQPQAKLLFKDEGKLVFKGKCTIAEGCSIFIDGGILELGKNIYINKNVCVQCVKKITIGDGALLGWNINLRDTDGHMILENNIAKESEKEIEIGNKTWIASDCTILKGTSIANNCIIGCNSLVCGKKYSEQNVLIAGSPARVIKQNVSWVE